MAMRIPLSRRDAFLLLLSFVVGALGTTLWFRSAFIVPANQENKEILSIEVPQNANLKKVAKKLEQEKIINDWRAIYYRWWIKKDKEDWKLLPGEYRFSPSSSPKSIYEDLKTGKVFYYKLTIPEGLRVSEIIDLMAKTGLTTSQEVQMVLADKKFMAELAIPSDSFEGYLFPETYRFTRPTDARSMIRTMVLEGRKQIDLKVPSWLDKGVALNLTPHEILVLASVIEKETGKAEERARISSVFHNRMRIRMPLQSDPTVIYGLANFNGDLTKRDLEIPTPFNTYTRVGLPPTPICSPGIEAIRAAVEPEDTAYLYFVGKGDGSHVFSETLGEHNAAVNTYQRKTPEPLQQ